MQEMDTSAIVSKFLRSVSDSLGAIRSRPLRELDVDLLRLMRTRLGDKLDEFREDLAAAVNHEKGRVQQDLISHGLDNSTVRTSTLAAIDRQAVSDAERATREYSRANEEIAILERRLAESPVRRIEPSPASGTDATSTLEGGDRMFNVLVSADATAWESDQRMGMLTTRFLEHSGDESKSISLNDPQSLKPLERVQSVLLYEDGVDVPSGRVVRIGQMHDIRVQNGRVTFRFAESGRIPSDRFSELRHRMQISEWEMNRTHWAVKDGEIPQDVLAHVVPTPKRYDVVLSFAGEDRAYVERVAEFLEDHGVVVFYDRYEQVTLWGKDLAEHFDGVYRKQGRFCIMFVSRYYAEKMWTRHERRSALARALEERVEYVLPARFDATEIPGLRPTIGYLDLRNLAPDELGELILKKLGRR